MRRGRGFPAGGQLDGDGTGHDGQDGRRGGRGSGHFPPDDRPPAHPGPGHPITGCSRFDGRSGGLEFPLPLRQGEGQR